MILTPRFGGGPGGCDCWSAAAGMGPGGGGGGTHCPDGAVVGGLGTVTGTIGGVSGAIPAFCGIALAFGGVMGCEAGALAKPLQPPGGGAAVEPGAVKLIDIPPKKPHAAFIGDGVVAGPPHAAFIAAARAASALVGPAHTSKTGDCHAMESNWGE